VDAILEEVSLGIYAPFISDLILNEQPPSWTIRINDTGPIFFYCSAPGSCIKYGMVGVINPVCRSLPDRSDEDR
jgi:hypothetical protein